jgi:hypothetical protein
MGTWIHIKYSTMLFVILDTDNDMGGHNDLYLGANLSLEISNTTITNMS